MSNTNQNQKQSQKSQKVQVSSAFKCKRCGRPLKAPESQALGYGHTCAIKEGIVTEKSKITNKKDSMNVFEFI